MVEFRKVQVGEILGNVVADRHAAGRIYDAVQKPKHIGVFQLAPNDLFKYAVVDGGIELAHVDFKTVPRPVRVTAQVGAQLPKQRVNTTPTDAGMGVRGELWRPDGFKHLHDCPLDNTVTKRQFIDFATFRFVFDKHLVRGGRIGSGRQFRLQLPQVSV